MPLLLLGNERKVGRAVDDLANRRPCPPIRPVDYSDPLHAGLFPIHLPRSVRGRLPPYLGAFHISIHSGLTTAGSDLSPINQKQPRRNFAWSFAATPSPNPHKPQLFRLFVKRERS